MQSLTVRLKVISSFLTEVSNIENLIYVYITKIFIIHIQYMILI